MKKIGAICCFVLMNVYLIASPASRSDTLDIRKTKIEMNITDFVSKNITGKSSLLIKSKQNNVQQALFDFEGLSVDSVLSNGQLLTFTHSLQTLNIQLPNVLNLNDSIFLDVYYHGVPISDPQWGGFSYVGNYAFQMGVGFTAQPHSFGRTWHPCFDNFVERSPYEFVITTNDDKMAVCNGLLIDSFLNPNNTITWHWKLDEEIPSYLASVAVCNYVLIKKVLNGVNGNIDALIACEAVDSNKVNGSFSHLQESFTMLEQNFGPYLWPRVGYSLVPFNAGAMEHATNIHIGKPFVDGTLNYETLIAHELSHHWWGDLVTCSTAGDMWLNEGFASYCELLHQEYTYGKDAYQDAARLNHFNVLAKTHVNDDGYKAVANIDSLHTYGMTVYSKGADMIHTLRSYLGDSMFFSGLSAFLNHYKFKDVSTIQLRDFLNNYTGKNMNPFFDNWILSPGFTHFSIDSTQIIQNGNVYDTKVFLRQRKHHSTDYYSQVPLELGFYDEQMNLYIHSLEFSNRCLEFDIQLPFEPKLIVIDPNSKISDATTEEKKIITGLGVSNFTQAKMKLFTKEILLGQNDSALIQVEHHWVAPDRFKSQAAANNYILNDVRYWRVAGINLDKIKGIFQFDYDGRSNNNYLDSNWVKLNNENQIHLFYRKDATEEWQIANDSLKVGGLNDRFGTIYTKEIKEGEYCFGIKKTNYTDPITTDAPNGGCAIVTNTQTISLSTNETEFIVYPNPALNEINIKSFQNENKELLVELYNLNGQVLLKKNIYLNQTAVNIQLPKIKSGLYFFKIHDLKKQHTYRKKIIIE